LRSGGNANSSDCDVFLFELKNVHGLTTSLLYNANFEIRCRLSGWFSNRERGDWYKLLYLY